VCGEAAGDPALIPKLVALGATELSMGAPAIPRAKKVVSEI
jgi:phosphoenolpyruvate-protein kinase (PTS system EI component)